eukprot:2888141-Lingulodinium_polyedra.AAC.1
MERSGRPFPLQKYRECKTWAAKRDFVSKLSLDKECTFLECEEKEFLAEKHSTEEKSGWCYLWDVARLNSIQYVQGSQEQNELLLSLVEGCPQMESDNPVLKERGHKLYLYSKEYEASKLRTRGKAIQVKASGKLEHADGKEAAWSTAKRMLEGEKESSEPNKKHPKKDNKPKEVDPFKKNLGLLKKAITELYKMKNEADITIVQFSAKTKEPYFKKGFLNSMMKEAEKIESMIQTINKTLATSSPESGSSSSSSSAKPSMEKLKEEAVEFMKTLKSPSSMLQKGKRMMNNV